MPYKGPGKRTSRTQAESIGVDPGNFVEPIPYDAQAGCPPDKSGGTYSPKPEKGHMTFGVGPSAPDPKPFK